MATLEDGEKVTYFLDVIRGALVRLLYQVCIQIFFLDSSFTSHLIIY